MKPKHFFVSFTIASGMLLCANVAIVWQITERNEQAAEVEQLRFQSHELARELRQSSDDLTRMARSYAATGDPKFKKYFYEIQSIRDGKSPRPKRYSEIYWDYVVSSQDFLLEYGEPVAHLSLFQNVGLTEQELGRLEEAKRNSDELINLEAEAFLLVEDTTGDPKRNRQRAIEILFGKRYHDAKARIMHPIDEFAKLLKERTEAAVNRENARVAQLIGWGNVVGIATVLFLIMSLVANEYWIVKPTLREHKERLKSQRLYRTLFETSHDAILTLSPELVPIQANVAAIEMFEARDLQQLQQNTPVTLSTEKQPNGTTSAEEVHKMFDLVLQHGAYTFEWTFRTLNGGRFTSSTLITPFENEGQTYFQVCIRDITQQVEDEHRVAVLNQKLIESARSAGMAEVATNVLHNVGNVFNSISTSACWIRQQLRKSVAKRFARVSDMIAENEDNLQSFVKNDARASHLPEYMRRVTTLYAEEQTKIDDELSGLLKNIEHVKAIISVQQSYSVQTSVVQEFDISKLLDDTLKTIDVSFKRDGIRVERDFDLTTCLNGDKHKVMQIVVNLVKNAKQALLAGNQEHSRLLICTRANSDDQTMTISVSDNGLGICASNLERIFQHGFTTKDDGHGFGLHSCANYATEMGGKLTVSSAGPGLGATFTLQVPLDVQAVQVESVPEIQDPATSNAELFTSDQVLQS